MKIYVINDTRAECVAAAYSGCKSAHHAVQTFLEDQGYTLSHHSRSGPSRFYVVEGGMEFTVQPLVVKPVLDRE